MKKLSLLFSMLFISAVVFSQTNGPEIKFDKTVHDYGTIVQNADGVCEFVFTNIGNEPLVLSNVSSSCGCTVPEWPKHPVMPRQSASIKVKYDTRRVGTISKSVTVFSNAVTDRVMLRLKGSITATPESKLPEKPQNLMKQ